ncbi:hypothetical protein J2W21_002508 [Sinomonas atrocyanea]|jgi:hypothetical protein|nr:hypothetical protein [Sinomonas atrocyanea]
MELRHLVEPERVEMSPSLPHMVFRKRRLRLGDMNVMGEADACGEEPVASEVGGTTLTSASRRAGRRIYKTHPSEYD